MRLRARDPSPPTPESNAVQKILVFDLDETLVFATLDEVTDPDFVLELAGQRVYLRVRPGVAELIESVRPHYTCRVWSTGQPIYVEAVCQSLKIEWMEFWGRDRCRQLTTMIEGHREPYDKPLSWISEDLERIAIVDNSPGVYACNPRNGIPIDSWHGDRSDRQLDLLQHYLRWLAERSDMRRDHNTWTTETLLMRNAQGIHLKNHP